MATDTHTAARRPSLLSLGVVLAVLLGSVLSVLLTGFLPFANDNIYHWPILTAAFDLPQFAHDSYIQSLRYFSSGFWLIFTGVSRYVGVEAFLAFWFVVTRLLMFAAFVHLAISLGYRGTRFFVIYGILLALSVLMTGAAVGGGGLNISYFEHSELANVTLVLGFSYAIRRNYFVSFLFCGVTAFLNAFFAVWMIVPILALAYSHLRSGEVRLKTLIGAAPLAVVCTLPLTIPVVLNLFAAHAGGEAMPVSYRTYAADFFPFHFFITGLSVTDVAQLLVILAIGLVAAALAKDSDSLFALFAGAVLVLGVGAILPFLTDIRILLNLVLIRSAVMIYFVAAAASSAVVAEALAGDSRSPKFGWGGLAFAGLVAGKIVLPLALVALAAMAAIGRSLRLPGSASAGPWIRYAGLACIVAGLLVAIPLRIVPTIVSTQNMLAQTDKWAAAGDWVAANTAPDASFIVPIDSLYPSASDATPFRARMQQLSQGLLAFGFHAQRVVWADAKYGAAVMWTPSYYEEWKSRTQAVKDLGSTDAQIQYARSNGVPYVAGACDATSATAAYQVSDVCIYGPLHAAAAVGNVKPQS